MTFTRLYVVRPSQNIQNDGGSSTEQKKLYNIKFSMRSTVQLRSLLSWLARRYVRQLKPVFAGASLTEVFFSFPAFYTGCTYLSEISKMVILSTQRTDYFPLMIGRLDESGMSSKLLGYSTGKQHVPLLHRCKVSSQGPIPFYYIRLTRKLLSSHALCIFLTTQTVNVFLCVTVCVFRNNLSSQRYNYTLWQKNLPTHSEEKLTILEHQIIA